MNEERRIRVTGTGLLRLKPDLCRVDLTLRGLEPKRLRLVSAGPDRAPSLFLLELRKGATPGLVTEPTLYQRDHNGTETAEYRRICHWEERP